jgi:hypothetical protein
LTRDLTAGTVLGPGLLKNEKIVAAMKAWMNSKKLGGSPAIAANGKAVRVSAKMRTEPEVCNLQINITE